MFIASVNQGCKIRPYSDFKKSLSVSINVGFCFPKRNSSDVQDRNILFYFSYLERVSSSLPFTARALPVACFA